MRFQPNATKKSIKIRFIEGAIGRFDGRALYVPYGDKKPLTRRKFILQMRKVIAMAKQNRISSIAADFRDIKLLAPKDFSDNEIGKVTAEAFVMANYEHNTYKKKPKEGFASVDVVAVTNTPNTAKREGANRDASPRFEEGKRIGEQIAAEVNACRELANTPGGNMTPKKLAKAAKKAIAGTKATLKVLGKREMEKLGMGAVLGVAQGSSEEPQFIILEYWGARKPQSEGAPSVRRGTLRTQGAPVQENPIVLIGKGVTFDSGGLNVKGGEHMYEMHMDMSGGAAVIHAVALAAKLGIKANVVGLVPAVENMPSGSSIRPGDILKSLSGRTIEVLNTDAEGRIILADAITYAKQYNPTAVVGAATLTGAALVALGVQCSAVMSTDDDFRNKLIEMGEESGDYLWPFPLWDEYESMVKGNFGDVPNISTEGNSRYGGVIAGGMFLNEFAKDLKCPFAHLDIAPRMTAAPNEFLAKGAAGVPVRLFFKLIESYQS